MTLGDTLGQTVHLRAAAQAENDMRDLIKQGKPNRDLPGKILKCAKSWSYSFGSVTRLAVPRSVRRRKNGFRSITDSTGREFWKCFQPVP
jgi:hypothetical protein